MKSPTTASILEGLNEEQVAAVRHDKGRAMLSAIAGSGKTLVVVRRIAYLVQERGVDPERILAVTFSKKAAEEMNRRLVALIGKTEARVGTIHSLAYQIIRTEEPTMREWSIDSDGYQVRGFARGYLQEAKIRGFSAVTVADFMEMLCNKGLYLPEHRDQITVLARAFLEPESWAAPRLLKAVEWVEQQCERQQVLTFGQMLLRAELKLRNDLEARKRWQRRWDYVVQDEAQDQSRVQASLMDLLVEEHNNYMMVGDSLQSVYMFRGAEPATFKAAGKRAVMLPLAVNYRSAKAVIDTASKIFGSRMICASGLEGQVRAVVAPELAREADVVAELVAQSCQERAPHEIAVLSRTSAGLVTVEHALRRLAIPSVNLSAVNFYKRREVAGLMAYLRFALGDYSFDTTWLSMQVPLRYITRKDAELVWSALARGTAGATAGELLRRAGRQQRQVDNMERWTATLKAVMQAFRAGESPAALLNVIFSESDFDGWLQQEEAEDKVMMERREHVNALVALAGNYETAAEFVADFDCMAKEHKARHHAAKDTRKEGHVTLGTIHAFKGLEREHVIVSGCNVGAMPHWKASKTEEIEEERRIFYVATTRPRVRLDYVCSDESWKRGATRGAQRFDDAEDPYWRPGAARGRKRSKRTEQATPSSFLVQLEGLEWDRSRLPKPEETGNEDGRSGAPVPGDAGRVQRSLRRDRWREL